MIILDFINNIKINYFCKIFYLGKSSPSPCLKLYKLYIHKKTYKEVNLRYGIIEKY